jgi:hypothetical protein
VNYFLKVNAVSSYFNSHLAEAVKVIQPLLLIRCNKQLQTLQRIKPISLPSIAVPCGSQKFSVLTEKIHVLLTLKYWFSFSEIKGYGILESENVLKNVCYILLYNKILIKVNGKIHPRTGHERPEGELRNSSTLSLTLALDGGR